MGLREQENQGIERIDAVLLTHGHMDACGGMSKLQLMNGICILPILIYHYFSLDLQEIPRYALQQANPSGRRYHFR